jgi:hypothetical protein
VNGLTDLDQRLFDERFEFHDLEPAIEFQTPPQHVPSVQVRREVPIGIHVGVIGDQNFVSFR